MRINSSGSVQVMSGGIESRSGLDCLNDHRHVVGELLVGVCVVFRVASDLNDVLLLVLTQEQVIAIVHGSECRLHEKGHEPVLDQLELLDDLGPYVAQGIGKSRELKPREKLLGDGRTTHDVSPFEDQGSESCLGEIGTVDQSVMAAADHYRVVLLILSHFRSSGCFVGWVVERHFGDDRLDVLELVIDRDLVFDFAPDGG